MLSSGAAPAGAATGPRRPQETDRRRPARIRMPACFRRADPCGNAPFGPFSPAATRTDVVRLHLFAKRGMILARAVESLARFHQNPVALRHHFGHTRRRDPSPAHARDCGGRRDCGGARAVGSGRAGHGRRAQRTPRRRLRRGRQRRDREHRRRRIGPGGADDRPSPRDGSRVLPGRHPHRIRAADGRGRVHAMDDGRGWQRSCRPDVARRLGEASKLVTGWSAHRLRPRQRDERARSLGDRCRRERACTRS